MILIGADVAHPILMLANREINDEETNLLIYSNKSRFRKVFAQHFPGKDGKISVPEFLKLCKVVKIFPDLIPLMELKKTLKNPTFVNGITYPSFEILLKVMASQSFNTAAPLADKLRMLLIHIRNSFKMHYQVNLQFNSRKIANKMSPTFSDDSLRNAFEPLKRTEESNRKPKRNYKSMSLARQPAPPKEERKSNLKIAFNTKKYENPDLLVIENPEPPVTLKKMASSPFSLTYHGLPTKSSLGNSTKKNAYCVLLKNSEGPLTGPHARTRSEDDSWQTGKKNTEIARIFSQFKHSHQLLVLKKPAIPNSQVVIHKQREYLCSIRNRMFERRFVMRLIFNAWKGNR